MDEKESIKRVVWTSFEFSKNTIIENIISAINSGVIKVDSNNLGYLVNIVQSSSEDAYQKCIGSVSNQILGLTKANKEKVPPKGTSKKN
jgi:hypothetical protein